jgi:hypothetical protein
MIGIVPFCVVSIRKKSPRFYRHVCWFVLGAAGGRHDWVWPLLWFMDEKSTGISSTDMFVGLFWGCWWPPWLGFGLHGLSWLLLRCMFEKLPRLFLQTRC